MESLAPHILEYLSKWLSLEDYINLRATNRLFHGLKQAPTLSFNTYRQSTELYDEALRAQVRMRLDPDEVCDESMLFLARNGHAKEFIHTLTHKPSLMSAESKEKALKAIVASDFSPDIVEALVMDGEVDINCQVVFSIYDQEFDDCEQFVSTGMHWACVHGHEDLLDLLMSMESVDMQAADVDGQQAIHYAALGGHLSIVQRLARDNRVDMNAQTFRAWKGIHTAAASGHADVMEFFLKEAKADISSLTYSREQPIHCAVKGGSAKVLKLLLNHPNVDPCAQDAQGWESIHYAAKWGREEIMKMLLQDPRVDPNSATASCWQPSHIAAMNGRVNILKMLAMDGRVDLSACSSNGIRPICMAIISGCEETVEYLRGFGS